MMAIRVLISMLVGSVKRAVVSSKVALLRKCLLHAAPCGVAEAAVGDGLRAAQHQIYTRLQDGCCRAEPRLRKWLLPLAGSTASALLFPFCCRSPLLALRQELSLPLVHVAAVVAGKSPAFVELANLAAAAPWIRCGQQSSLS